MQIKRFNSLTTPIAMAVIVLFEALTLAAGQLVQTGTYIFTQTQISASIISMRKQILLSRFFCSHKNCFPAYVKRHLNI